MRNNENRKSRNCRWASTASQWSSLTRLQGLLSALSSTWTVYWNRLSYDQVGLEVFGWRTPSQRVVDFAAVIILGAALRARDHSPFGCRDGPKGHHPGLGLPGICNPGPEFPIVRL